MKIIFYVMMLILVKVVYIDSSDCVNTHIKLTELSPSLLGQAFQFRVNEWPDDDTKQLYTSITMGDGNIYDDFIVLHPPYEPPNESTMDFAYVVYDLNGKYNTFTAVIGMENNNKCVINNIDGINYKFYLDGMLVYESQQLIKYQYQNININVQNVNKLKIEVYKLGTVWCDHATIANPVLETCAPPTQTNCEWKLMYENDWGNIIFGNTLDLIENIRGGHDLRIVGTGIEQESNWVYAQPERIWIREDRVYVYNKGTVSINFDENLDLIFDILGTKLSSSVYDTTGLIYYWIEGSETVTKDQYGHAKWFTRC